MTTSIQAKHNETDPHINEHKHKKIYIPQSHCLEVGTKILCKYVPIQVLKYRMHNKDLPYFLDLIIEMIGLLHSA